MIILHNFWSKQLIYKIATIFSLSFFTRFTRHCRTTSSTRFVDSDYIVDSAGVGDSTRFGDSTGVGDSTRFMDSVGVMDSTRFMDSAGVRDSTRFGDSTGVTDSTHIRKFFVSIQQWFCISAVCLLGGCAVYNPLDSDTSDTSIDIPADNLQKVLWSDIDGWNEDSHAQAIPVFLRSCEKLKDEWRKSCDIAATLPEDISNDAAREFFEKHFLPYQLQNKSGDNTGLITGYYEPLLRGDTAPSSRYKYPIYTRPTSMLHIDIAELYPSLAKQRVRGRLENGKIIPYYSRAEIDSESSLLAGNELLWVEDKVALFFLHIQGSGLVLLPTGEIIGVGYADQNGHPYRSIGRLLVERGEMELEEVNLFSIREWLKNNPTRADKLLYDNPSYVFFTKRKEVDIGPIGSLGVILTPNRSLAIDPSFIPPGAPVWLNTASPDKNAPPLAQLMMAQDTGGAIRGDIRADFFWGRGQEAETMAGLMKSQGQLFVLLPR